MNCCFDYDLGFASKLNFIKELINHIISVKI